MPWLFGIATNVLRRHARDEERRLRALARLDRPAMTHDPIPQEPLLAEALRSLSPGERDVLLLYAWADLSYKEIASTLGIALGTVRSRLHGARMHVRAELEQLEAVDG